jgi:hypothetical protein
MYLLRVLVTTGHFSCTRSRNAIDYPPPHRTVHVHSVSVLIINKETSGLLWHSYSQMDQTTL